ncbi:MAG: 5'/3'-nucleotidase SurE [Planctomycetota bacterium]
MKILVTNDDGVFAPGLASLAKSLEALGEVVIAAPATEQSGVGHSITYLTPLTCKSIHRDGKHWAYAVDGSPADCVKLAVTEIFKEEPVDLVVSGINSGLNSGISVLYSGTVAAAIEGAFFGIPSLAVSLEYDADADFDRAAELCRPVVDQIAKHCVGHDRNEPGPLFNMNIPTAATREPAPAEPAVVPMGLGQYGRSYEMRRDPKGRRYYWALWNEPPVPPPEDADVAVNREGRMTVTPLKFDMTDRRQIEEMRHWDLGSQRFT